MKSIVFGIVVLFAGIAFAQAPDARTFGPALQDLSVNIKAGMNEGSGVIITRERKLADGKSEKVHFIWTAGHVVAGLRSVRTVIDAKGTPKQVVEFQDAAFVKETTKNGRRVGESKMDVKVIKYSDADNGEDLALLQMIATDYFPDNKNTVFYLKPTPQDEIVPVGTTLYHVGCLLGQMGANSFTTGVMSQTGRVRDKKVYDQTSVTAFPGSSGGGVWMMDAGKPVYVGMLVRGAGETFNLIVPVRRIHEFASKYKLEWALDEKKPLPPQADIDKIVIEESGVDSRNDTSASKPAEKPTTEVYFMDYNNAHKWRGNPSYLPINIQITLPFGAK